MLCAITLLVLGLVVAFVPGLAAENGFLRAIHLWSGDSSETRDWWMYVPGRFHMPVLSVDRVLGTSALDLIRSEVEWAIVAASLGLVPVLFGWWRRAGVGFARTGGVGVSVAAAASVIALVGSMRGLSDLPAGVWWTVPLGGALMAAAFLVAPTPRVRDE
jgi:hypothetical protein